MDFVGPAKQKELVSALKHRGSSLVVVHGPPGSSKTHAIERAAHSLGLSIEYMEDVGMYKNMLPTAGTICLADLDDYDHLSRLRDRLGKMRNMVIETRTLPSIGKLVPNTITVNFPKVSSRKIQRFYRLSEEDACLVDGNLHAVKFYKYSVRNEMTTIFHQLGRLFHSKAVDIPKAVERIGVYGRDRFLGYLMENCVFFMSMDDVSRLSEGLSLQDVGAGSLEHLVWVVASSTKAGVRKFFSFRPLRGIHHVHVCTSICTNR